MKYPTKYSLKYYTKIIPLLLILTLILGALPALTENKLLPIPEPPLEHLEAAVSQQLRNGRKILESIAGDTAAARSARANAYGDLGDMYHAYELYESAAASYRNALTFKASAFDWNYALAYLLQSTGDFPGAVGFYNKALTIIQKDPALLYLVYIRFGECYHKMNTLAEAKKYFDLAYRLNPQGASILARLGKLAVEEKQYEKAITYLVKALEMEPQANQLHYPLAMAYRATGKMDLARLHLGKLGKVNLQPPDPLKTRLDNLRTGCRLSLISGKMAYSAGRFKEAEDEFRKAVAANPKEVPAHINLGTTLGQMKKYREAIACFNAALQLDPNNVTAHFNLGTIYNFWGETGKAIPHLKKVLEVNNKDAEVYMSLGDALYMKNRLDEALESYKSALLYKKELSKAWINISILLSIKKKHKEALDVLIKAHTSLPSDGSIAHAYARLLATTPLPHKRNGQKALNLAMAVFKISSHYDHAQTIAFAYAELNQCNKAEEWMQKAINLATSATQPKTTMDDLKRNLAFLKSNRPCRVPIK
ncbi:MAG: tetratricopeptide repeat protein [bacterium]|nr:tetratricopeptide repeat protein [bacterium]